MNALWNDIKYGLRMLAKSPCFVITVIFIIGMGIGANTAIFNALDQVSLRPLPVKKPHELVSIQYNSSYWLERGQIYIDGMYNYPVYETYRDQSDVFSDLIAFSYDDMILRTNQDIQQIQVSAVSGNYFSVLDVTPAIGRVFSPEQEPDTAANSVVIISDQFRHQHFGKDDNVIGENVIINDHSLTIVGVMPPEFAGTVVGWIPDVYIPLGTCAGINNNNMYRDTWKWLHLLGRLKPGISREQAQISLGTLSRNLMTSGLANVNENILVLDGNRGWIASEAEDFQHPLTLFMIIAAFILVIMSVNIANMQLARAANRQKEIAIRQALGAGRWQIIRQLLVEGLLLALAGGVCGVVLAVWIDRIMCVLLSRIGSISLIPGLNLRVLPFALSVCLFAGLVFGLAPALQVVRRNVVPALKESSGFVEVRSRRWNPHHLLVTIQVTLAIVVLACTSLLIRSVIILNNINPGYDTSKLLAVSLEGWNFNRPDLRQFFENLQERIKGLPGIETTSLANLVPLGERVSMRGVTHIDGVEIPEQERSSWWYGVVDTEYFNTLNMPLLAGRTFTAQDNLQSARVMIINNIMARKYWPDQNPVGHYVTYASGLGEGSWIVEIIGVVKASKMRSITEGEKAIAYWPLAQDTQLTPVLLIRTSGNAHLFIPIIRKEITSLGLNEVYDISTVADRVSNLLYPQHAVTGILNTFGLAGLLLCVTGLYSVITYSVRQRTREIGIRIALGAQKRQVILSVLRKGVWLTIMGLALGIGLSLITLYILNSQLTRLQDWDKFFLYGVSLWDPLTLIIVLLFVLVVALLACYIPARRAANIDPIDALRYE